MSSTLWYILYFRVLFGTERLPTLVTTQSSFEYVDNICLNTLILVRLQSALLLLLLYSSLFWFLEFASTNSSTVLYSKFSGWWYEYEMMTWWLSVCGTNILDCCYHPKWQHNIARSTVEYECGKYFDSLLVLDKTPHLRTPRRRVFAMSTMKRASAQKNGWITNPVLGPSWGAAEAWGRKRSNGSSWYSSSCTRDGDNPTPAEISFSDKRSTQDSNRVTSLERSQAILSSAQVFIVVACYKHCWLGLPVARLNSRGKIARVLYSDVSIRTAYGRLNTTCTI